MSTNDVGTTGQMWFVGSRRQRRSMFERALWTARLEAAEASRARRLSELRLWVARSRSQQLGQDAR